MQHHRAATAPYGDLDPPKPLCSVAVLIDGSALFLENPEEKRLNYFALNEVLVSRVPGLQLPIPNGASIWSMWTAADSRNAGQMKFLEFAEQRLHWSVRTVPPRLAFTVEPEALFGIGSADASRFGRLIRFDAPIAFAMGRLAESHRLVVVSDSFALASTMARVNEHWGADNNRCALAFFGRACDQRWRGVLRDEFAPEFIDLDDHQSKLFGIEEKEVRSDGRKAERFVF